MATSPMRSRENGIATSGQGLPRQVDDDPGQRLVQRRVGVAEPGDAGTVAQGLVETAAEHDGAVLDRVVVVDFHISCCPEGQVDAGVTRQRGQHVVEEPETGGDVAGTCPVEIECHLDLGLGRLPGHLSAT